MNSEASNEANPAANDEADLRSLAHALADLRWVQGPGGNVSVKTQGALWVKASGTTLRELGDGGPFARVPLAMAERALAGDREADKTAFAGTPRPSLEMYFHALPGRVVAHTHAVGVLLHACAKRASDADLAGTQAIPYVRPGRGIALAMQPLRRAGEEQVIVLRSHGVVAFAETVPRAVALLEEADARAREGFGLLPPLEDVLGAFLERAPLVAPGVFCQRVPSKPVRGPSRYLFPDAVVCATVVDVPSLEGDDATLAAAARVLADLKRPAVLRDADGRRAVVAASPLKLRESCEVLAAHDWVDAALAPRDLAAYLPDDEPAQIVQMPSEQYRIHLHAPA